MWGMRGRPHSRRDSGSDWDWRDYPMHGSIYTIDLTLPPYVPYYAVNRTRANVFLNCRADLTCARVARVILGAPMALGCVFLG